ncbi:MAG: hypothetical protein JOZ15_19245, partial [Acidobacteria bacterium]|nr:hypothetical protein [Acidobacteriota bacterium]
MTMKRAIAPALAQLLLIVTLPPASPARGATAAPPERLPAVQPKAPPAPVANPANPANTAPGSAIVVSDEKMMTEVMQALVEARQEYGVDDDPVAL